MYSYRQATLQDIAQLLEFRLCLLHSAIGEGRPDRWENVKEHIIQYYQEALSNDTHLAYLVYDGNRCIATGGVCFYQILPTYYKPTGKKAYLINLYTVPEYRRRGVATQVLNLLIDESLQRGATYISLEATDMGRSLYEKCGFATLTSEMQFRNETYEGNIKE